MGNCKDCKHWTSYETTVRGRCEAVYEADEHKQPRLAVVTKQDDGGEDAPYGVAQFWTAPEFGCVLWEGKI